MQGVPEICSARRCGARDHLDTEIRYTATTVDACALAYQRASNDACFATIMQRIVIVDAGSPGGFKLSDYRLGIHQSMVLDRAAPPRCRRSGEVICRLAGTCSVGGSNAERVVLHYCNLL